MLKDDTQPRASGLRLAFRPKCADSKAKAVWDTLTSLPLAAGHYYTGTLATGLTRQITGHGGTGHCGPLDHQQLLTIPINVAG